MKITFFFYIFIKTLTNVNSNIIGYDVSQEDGFGQNIYSLYRNNLNQYLDQNDFLSESKLNQLDGDRSFDLMNGDYWYNKNQNLPSYEDFKSIRQQESESHSTLLAGHQYVSGGAGEGKQHLRPDGKLDNKYETKSDEDLPAYCDPPNPCPINEIGDDCDPRPYNEFTADFSKKYQDQQNCMCDEDHNECSKTAKPKSLDRINKLLDNIKELSILSDKVK